MLDVTEDAKEIMKAVRDINMRKNCNLTLVYLTDIFKGSDLKKIRESGLHLSCVVIVKKLNWYQCIYINDTTILFIGLTKHPLYGRGKSWKKNDIERLLHYMVLQEYLQEHMYISNEIACAYVKIGPKASELMTKKDIKVFIFNRIDPECKI